MKIKKIDINGFGKFEDRLFTLKPGMNVFFGCNESGKSTLQSFIKGMLFGLKGGRRAKDGTLPPLKQYKPWVAKTYGGTLEYELDNGHAYTVGRNFDKNTVTIYDEYSNNITGNFPADREEGVKFAEQHLGLSESCFDRTVFIGQMQSVINNEGKKVIAERLTNIKQTGDEEVSFRKAISALKDAQLSYVGSGRTTTRPLNIINSRLQQATEEEEEYTRLHENCMDIFLELDQLQKREAELKNKFKELNKISEKLVKQKKKDKLKNLCHSLNRCYKQLSDIENSIVAKKEEYDSTLAQLHDYEVYKNYSRNDSDEMVSDYTNYKLLCKELADYKLENEENEEKIEKTQMELEQYNLFSGDTSKMDEVIQEVLQYNRISNDENTQKKPHVNIARRASLAGLLLAVIALVFSFLFIPNRTIFNIAGLVIFVMMAIISILVTRDRGRKKDDYAKKSEQDLKHLKNMELLNSWMEQVKVNNIHDFIRLKNMFEDKNKRLQEFIDKRKELTDIKNKMVINMEEFRTRILHKLTSANIVNGLNFEQEDIQKWRASLETYNTLIQEAKDKEIELSSLIQKKESLYREASVILGFDINLLTELDKEIQKKIAEFDILTDSEPTEVTLINGNLTVDSVNNQIKQIDEELDRVTLRINTLSTRLENIPDGEMIQQAHEKVQYLTEERGKKVALGKALETAIEVLSKASVEIQRNYSPYLNETMGNIIDGITDGKYTDIMADDSLRLNVQPPNTAEKVMPEQLSSGTADQMYFALRLATVMLVEKNGETLPLFLDEPFVQYDEDRTKNALLLLNNESDKRQIILFTCKKREVELAQQIFSSKDINIVNL